MKALIHGQIRLAKTFREKQNSYNKIPTDTQEIFSRDGSLFDQEKIFRDVFDDEKINSKKHWYLHMWAGNLSPITE